MTTDTVELMQMIYQAQMDNAELSAYQIGSLILIAVLILWLCTVITIRRPGA